MATLLVKNIDILYTNDTDLGDMKDGAIFVRDNVIEQIGLTSELPTTADRVIDARGKFILPGFVNTHHHFFQTLTRAVPGAQDEELFDWLVRLYPIFSELDSEATYVSSTIAMAELILSGCTTSSDHQNLADRKSVV